jgi:hypothetical protein
MNEELTSLVNIAMREGCIEFIRFIIGEVKDRASEYKTKVWCALRENKVSLITLEVEAWAKAIEGEDGLHEVMMRQIADAYQLMLQARQAAHSEKVLGLLRAWTQHQEKILNKRRRQAGQPPGPGAHLVEWLMFTRTIHTGLVEGLAALGHGLEAIATGSSNSALSAMNLPLSSPHLGMVPSASGIDTATVSPKQAEEALLQEENRLRNDLVSKVHEALREYNDAIAKEDELHKSATRNEVERHASTMRIAKETCASAMGNMHKKMDDLDEWIVKDLEEMARIQSTAEETIALVEGMNNNNYEEWDRRLSEPKGDCLAELVKSKNNLFLSMKLVELKVKMDAERISSRLNSSSSSSSEDDNHDNNNTVSSHATNRGGVIKTVNTLIHLTTSISQQGKEEEGDNEEEEEEEQYHQVLAQVP